MVSQQSVGRRLPICVVIYESVTAVESLGRLEFRYGYVEMWFRGRQFVQAQIDKPATFAGSWGCLRVFGPGESPRTVPMESRTGRDELLVELVLRDGSDEIGTFRVFRDGRVATIPENPATVGRRFRYISY